MNLANYYYYFQSALPPRLCEDIIKYGTSHQPETAITGGVEREDGTSRKADGSLKKSVIKNCSVKIFFSNIKSLKCIAYLCVFR